MKTPTLTKAQLLALGFANDYEEPFVDEDISYDTMTIAKGDSYITVNFDYTRDGEFTGQYISINDRDLEGRLPTLEELKLLIELL